MYIFVLIYTDGKVRNDLLGITDDMYENYAKANAWHDSIFECLAVQPINVESSKARRILLDIYHNIVEGMKYELNYETK